MSAEHLGFGWLLGSLALQNLGRRQARTLLLVAAVAIGSGIVFTGATLMRSIETSMRIGFTRLGADLLVVPEGTLTNITAALLTVEPTDLAIGAGVLPQAKLRGVQRIAPQRIIRTQASGIGSHEPVDLIGFDPQRDFTVQPWLEQRLHREMQRGDIIVGARRDLPLGSEVLLFGRPHRVYGKLGSTGVGTHERGVFMTFETMQSLTEAVRQSTGSTPAALEPGKVSGFLVELAPGATSLQVRFAILSNLAGVKVVTGESMLSGVRQGLAALVNGMLALMLLTFASIALMVTVIFSAIVTERHHELGLLKAIGARRTQLIGMMVVEAVIATGIGGAVGVVMGLLVLRLYERSLVYHLNSLGLPFAWLDTRTTTMFAVASVLLAAGVGAVGALYPAWQASRRDPYDLIRGEI
jgi:putative ABC transport system permease protein